jgi:hypothetical protein
VEVVAWLGVALLPRARPDRQQHLLDVAPVMLPPTRPTPAMPATPATPVMPARPLLHHSPARVRLPALIKSTPTAVFSLPETAAPPSSSPSFSTGPIRPGPVFAASFHEVAVLTEFEKSYARP